MNIVKQFAHETMKIVFGIEIVKYDIKDNFSF